MSSLPILHKKVSDFLIFLIDPITCREDKPVNEVMDIFAENNIGCIAITDSENKVRGIFTERDYILKIAPNKNSDTSKIAIVEHMTPNPFCVDEQQTIGKILGIMRLNKFRHIIITNQDKTINKIISVKDLLDWLCDSLTE